MQHKLSASWYLGSVVLVAVVLVIVFLSIWRQLDKQVENSLAGGSEADGVLVIKGGESIKVLAEHEPLPELTYLPHHPFYLTRMIYQRIRLWLTMEDLEKATLLDTYADERMGVAGQLMAQGRGREAIEAMAKGYMYDLQAAEILRLYQTEEARRLWLHLAGATGIHEKAAMNLEAAIADNLKPKVNLIVAGLERLRKEAETKSGINGND